MHSLAYQHNTGIHTGAMINRAQAKAAPDHEKIRDAVRAWSSALDNQDVVSALIINEYQRGNGLRSTDVLLGTPDGDEECKPVRKALP